MGMGRTPTRTRRRVYQPESLHDHARLVDAVQSIKASFTKLDTSNSKLELASARQRKRFLNHVMGSRSMQPTAAPSRQSGRHRARKAERLRTGGQQRDRGLPAQLPRRPEAPLGPVPTSAWEARSGRPSSSRPGSAVGGVSAASTHHADWSSEEDQTSSDGRGSGSESESHLELLTTFATSSTPHTNFRRTDSVSTGIQADAAGSNVQGTPAALQSPDAAEQRSPTWGSALIKRTAERVSTMRRCSMFISDRNASPAPQSPAAGEAAAGSEDWPSPVPGHSSRPQTASPMMFEHASRPQTPVSLSARLKVRVAANRPFSAPRVYRPAATERPTSAVPADQTRARPSSAMVEPMHVPRRPSSSGRPHPASGRPTSAPCGAQPRVSTSGAIGHSAAQGRRPRSGLSASSRGGTPRCKGVFVALQRRPEKPAQRERPPLSPCEPEASWLRQVQAVYMNTLVAP
mmetsp:Transcript_16497/g.30463  ORF Transcript_16497/g.30463 Transcript_16497/m.30463 type:complete len:460 (-) Transcript_16497:64-1443(-)